MLSTAGPIIEQAVRAAWVDKGFAGMSGALLGVVVWLIWLFRSVVSKNSSAFCEHARATTELKATLDGLQKNMTNQHEAIRDLEKELIRRPCQMGQEKSRKG